MSIVEVVLLVRLYYKHISNLFSVISNMISKCDLIALLGVPVDNGPRAVRPQC